MHYTRPGQWRDSRANGSTVHLEAQMAAWLAGMDRAARSRFSVGEWQLSAVYWSYTHEREVTACRWERDHFTRVVHLDRTGLTERVLLGYVRKFVN